jgi:hemolysin III
LSAPLLTPLRKPILRGVSHQIAAGVAVVAWVTLAAMARGPRASIAAHVYGASLFTLFATSAFYHRPQWSPRVRHWLGQVDLSAIFILIAGTYTPFCLLLDGPRSTAMLAIAWGGAALGILQAMVWRYTPKAVAAGIYVGFSWIIVLMMPSIFAVLGWGAIVLLVSGGVIYSLGAAVYATRRPNPYPRVFGYHEVFHLLVIAGAGLHFIACVDAVRALG